MNETGMTAETMARDSASISTEMYYHILTNLALSNEASPIHLSLGSLTGPKVKFLKLILLVLLHDMFLVLLGSRVLSKPIIMMKRVDQNKQGKGKRGF